MQIIQCCKGSEIEEVMMGWTCSSEWGIRTYMWNVCAKTVWKTEVTEGNIEINFKEMCC